MGPYQDKRYSTSISAPQFGDAENIITDKRGHWVPDEEVTNCYSCNVTFNVRVRKHHCRACGNVFCSNCSDNKIKISEYGYSEKVRVCDKCFVERSSTQTLLLQEDLGARKQINQDLKKALSEKMAMVERFKTFLIEFDSEILNNNDNTNDVHSLLQRGEQGLKDLNDRIKSYDNIIENQKKELESLKKEKEQKTQLNKILNQRNHEIQQKNLNIKSLIKEKNELTMVKEESEGIINSYKKQVEKLIIRCNKLELENKNKSQFNTNHSFSNSSTMSFRQNSNNLHDHAMSISYTVSQGPEDERDDGHCCSYCRNGCAIM